MTTNSILSQGGKKGLTKYLESAKTVADFDVEEFKAVAREYLLYHKGNKYNSETLKPILDMMDRWYKSLDTTPDYSVYGELHYFVEVWLCWSAYSRLYLKNCGKQNSCITHSVFDDMRGVESVLDLGCGFGYTTVGLKEIFPDATVTGTNFPGSYQFTMAEKLGVQHGFSMQSSPVKADLIFASEYFEHFESPLEHLQEVLVVSQPRYLLVANAFTSTAIGHFKQYKHLGHYYDGKTMNRMFNKMMRNSGYFLAKTKLWNNRPRYWKKHISILEQ